MFYDILELLLNYMQYIYLTVMIAPDVFPTFYSSPFLLVDVVMSTVTSRGGSDALINKTNAKMRFVGSIESMESLSLKNGSLTAKLPLWVPQDTRLLFFFTNFVCPLAFVIICALLFGPLYFTVFLYLLCGFIFFFIAGVLLLATIMSPSSSLVQHAQSLEENTALSTIMHSVSTGSAIGITTMSGAVAVLLSVAGVTFYLIWRSRDRAKVMERLRMFENVPHRLEEHVAKWLLRTESAGLTSGGAEETQMEAQEQRARAELVHQRLIWRRYQETYSVSVMWTLIKIVVSLACLFLGVLFAFVRIRGLSLKYYTNQVCTALSLMFFFFGFLSVVMLIMGLTRKGREQLFAMKMWLCQRVLCAALLAVSFMYAPIVRNTINLFSCSLFCCTLTGIYNCSSNGFNESCGGCAEDTGATMVFRLSTDMRVPCSAIDNFYLASAIISCAAYAVFFVLLYTLITQQALRGLRHYPLSDSVIAAIRECESEEEGVRRRGTSAVQNTTLMSTILPNTAMFASEATISHLKGGGGKNNVAAVYYRRVCSSQNEVTFLYSAYTYKFRYFKLIVLAQKTAMVIFSTLMREGSGAARPWTGFAACFLLQFFLAIVLVVYKPYAKPLVFVISLALQIMLSAVAAMGLANKVVPAVVPHELWSFVTSCLFLVPCTALFFGAVLTVRRGNNNDKMRRKILRRRNVCNKLCFCGNWFLLLKAFLKKRKEKKKGSVRWYEQHGGEGKDNKTFIPALYFKLDKQMSSKINSSSSSSIRGSDAGVCFSLFDKQEQQPYSHRLKSLKRSCDSPVPDNRADIHFKILLEPEGSGSRTGRERARRYWAQLRSAVRFGAISVCGGRRGGHNTSTVFTPCGPRRRAEVVGAALSPQLMVTPSPEKDSLHSFAMTTLLASVANESLWEMSPAFSANGTRSELRYMLLGTQENSNDNEFYSSHHVFLSPEEVRKREIFLEHVQAFSARQRLLKMYSHDKRHLLLQQKAVDCYINAQVALIVRFLLLFLGVTVTVAVVLCLYAMLKGEPETKLPQSTCLP